MYKRQGFGVAALAIAGVPPFNGFFSKYPLFAAGFELGHEYGWITWLMVLALVESTACLLYTSITGATAIDCTLPIIQKSGGIEVTPIAISFGFVTNILPPLLLVFFSSIPL